MTLDGYNTFCGRLAHATHVVQWGNSHVWKVGGKMFAVAGFGHGGDLPAVTFKVSPLSYELLRDVPGCRPAPYLASRGMTWIQRVEPLGLDDDGLRDYLAASYALVAAGLPKRVRTELGLTQIEPGRAAQPHTAPPQSRPQPRRGSHR